DQEITASFGLATFPDDADNHKDLMALAHKALNAAKKKAGNRAILAESLPPSEISD
ncbi:MAG: diguanylate cyclase, partial [Candidatus Coatesbacteria bacterium]|nr:diguanylate cyclase [Candidatus Coatesbacteria bacterium]